MKTLTLIIALFCLISCGYKRIDYTPTPRPKITREANVARLERLLRSQTDPRYAFVDVSVDEEKITIIDSVKTSLGVGPVRFGHTAHNEMRNIYFEDVGELELHNKRDFWTCIVRHVETGEKLYQFGLKSEKMVKEFIDIMRELSES